jgi:hypothetical protein
MIDSNDFVYRTTSRHGKLVKNKLYRHTCDKCGADRGYQAKSYAARYCNRCSKLGLKKTDAIKQKMSQAAIKRYNDPNWKPKNSGNESFRGQRRSFYVSKTTPIQRKIKRSMKALLWQKLKNRYANKPGHTFDILGYTVDDLISHLESKFQPGMTWENYGRNGWHIDHVRPDSWFKYSSIHDADFKKSWSLENLQPMWATDNYSKGDRFEGVR